VYKSNVRTANYPLLEAGTGTHVEDNYANSYGDHEAIALHDDSEDVYLKNNRLRGGIKDVGSAGLKTVGNEFSEKRLASVSTRIMVSDGVSPQNSTCLTR